MATFNKKENKKAWEKPIKHRAKLQKQYTDDETAKMYNNARWRRLAAHNKIQNPLCVMCMKVGRYVAAQITDHIVPVIDCPDRFYDETNLQSLCKSCHAIKTNSDRSDRLSNKIHIR